MARRALLAATAALAAAALVYLALQAFSTPAPSWQPVLADPDEHVMSLAWDARAERLLAGAQSGRLFADDASGWETLAKLPAGITRIQPEPALLLGTTAGAYLLEADSLARLVPLPDAAADMRVSDVAALGHVLLIGGSEGVFRATEPLGTWQAIALEGLPQASVYRSALHSVSGGTAVHLGLIGAGVYTRLESGTASTGWIANNSGMRPQAKVLALYPLAGDGLLAGTDRGVYRQERPFERWHPVGQRLAELRVLTIARWHNEWWVGTDHGVYRGGAGADWRLVPTSQALARPVSTLVATPEQLYMAAGDVYRLEYRRPLDLAHVLIALLVALTVFTLVRR